MKCMDLVLPALNHKPMNIGESVKGRLVAAMAIAIATEREAIHSLTLLAACLRQPSASGCEALLAKGFSSTGIVSYLRTIRSGETSITVVEDCEMTDEAAAVLAHAARLAAQYAMSSVEEECLLLALLEVRTPECRNYMETVVSIDAFHDLVAYSRKHLKRLALAERHYFSKL